MRFVAFDVETANPDLSSICQVGLAYFDSGRCVDTWGTLVDPEDHFHYRNIKIHGIGADSVVGAPTFKVIADEFFDRLSSEIIVCHTAFDIASVRAVFAKHNLRPPSIRCIDSASVVRRVWSQFSHRGYGLRQVADWLGIEFKHHCAVEDAKASGQILVAAMQHSGIGLDELLHLNSNGNADRSVEARGRTRFPVREYIKKDGNPDGELFGEVVVFTGQLSMPRKEAASHAADVGCKVEPTVTKRTTILVVGDQDIRLLGGKHKSSKHLRAEELIECGQQIRIIKETDFETIVLTAKKAPEVSSEIVERSIDTPIRPAMPIKQLFNGPDKGLISAWEEGRKMRAREADEAIRAGRGELPQLCWAGGFSKELSDGKFGSLNYLAMWQGLRGESLFIDRARPKRITCSLYNRTVTFIHDYAKRAGKETESQISDEQE